MLHSAIECERREVRREERGRKRERFGFSLQPYREQEPSGVIHSANEMKRALEETIQQQLDSHQRQVEALKTEISAKEAHISQVNFIQAN